MKLSELYDFPDCGITCVDCGLWEFCNIGNLTCDDVWRHLCDCMLDEFIEAVYELGSFNNTMLSVFLRQDRQDRKE